MKISREWLQTFFEQPLPETQDLVHALTFHAFEIDGVERQQDDDVLDVKVTPNRGHDCLSYLGIAREVSAILSIPLKDREGVGERVSLEPRTHTFTVTIDEPALCPRFTGAVIENLKVGPSPEWLQKRLRAMGQQSINNVVDITNFIMFNYGQPLHAFDAGKLQAKDGAYAMTVRKARKGETLVGLDKKEYSLSESMLAIADSRTGSILSIAGVKGGMSSGIDEGTKTMILEGASWDGVTIRKTSQTLKLRTDASSRFEQQISPEFTALGVVRAAQMIAEIAGGRIAGYTDEYPQKQPQRMVTVTLEQVNMLLGTTLSTHDMEAALNRLHLSPQISGNLFSISVPPERLDITIPEDVIEEVGRIVGYDTVPNVELPPMPRAPEVSENFSRGESVREQLMNEGFSEVFTSVFTEKGVRAVSNKIGGDKPFLRDSLIEGLSDALTRNIQNKDLLGLKEVKLFEIGVVWQKDREVTMVATAVEKDAKTKKPLVSEKPLSECTLTEHGELPLSAAHKYETFSRYPYIVRDIALWCPKGTSDATILEDIRHHAGNLLVRSELFDTFEKGEKVSFAFRLVFQSFDRTLTDEDANERMESVYTSLRSRGLEIR